MNVTVCRNLPSDDVKTVPGSLVASAMPLPIAPVLEPFAIPSGYNVLELLSIADPEGPLIIIPIRRLLTRCQLE